MEVYWLTFLLHFSHAKGFACKISSRPLTHQHQVEGGVWLIDHREGAKEVNEDTSYTLTYSP